MHVTEIYNTAGLSLRYRGTVRERKNKDCNCSCYDRSELDSSFSTPRTLWWLHRIQDLKAENTLQPTQAALKKYGWACLT